MAAPKLFDQPALAMRRARAAGKPADFLLRHVAGEMADRLGVVLRPFDRVAEVASLSPILRDRLAQRLTGNYWRLGPALASPDIVAREDALPLGDACLDLVLSALSLHFVDDLPGTLLRIRQALRPDGLFLLALIGGTSLDELRQSFAAAEIEMEGGLSPRIAPFVEIRSLGALLQRAGFALPVADSDTLTVRYDSAFGLMRDLRAMGATNVLAERRRIPTRRRTMLRMAQIYGERFADGDGRVRATFEILWASGWAPHRSQQQPLKPGSAKMRLADALGVREWGADEKPGG